MKKLIILCVIIFSTALSNTLFSQHEDIYHKILFGKEQKASSISTAKSYRNPATATLYSLAYPGLGQIYNGQTLKGVGMIIFEAMFDIMIVYSIYQAKNSSDINERSEYPILAFEISTFAALVWVASMIDANRSARKINKYKGFSQLQFGKSTSLSINPDLKLIPQPLSPTTQTFSPSFGLNLSLSF
ncbi:MAG: hypothetical protein EOM29_10645 [Bacteroidia bacterium]|jgi:hypothetical protein|nr:DUF5683 domain-containing protein [Bacteroidales bacterium]NCC19384.1 hypothetical protein [Bacteroidia bacterium]